MASQDSELTVSEDDAPPLSLRFQQENAISPAALAMVGTTIADKYELIRVLGEGGMGAVYEARNRSTLKRCALKMLLSPELIHIPDVVRRFYREAQACSVVESEHIVQIFDSGEAPNTSVPFIVMEMLQGEDLQNVLLRVGAVPPMVAAKAVYQASKGLARAHELGIVHRDVKPANLFLAKRENGEFIVKVLDFGVAKIKMDNFSATHHDLTRTGAMIGTPRYMSPEQARGIAKIDVRSDVWSLGAVLYELLTGGSPYEETTALGELLLSIVTADIPLLQDKAPWVPPELAEITHRSMSRDISKRYNDAGELRDALEAVLGSDTTILPEMIVSVTGEQRASVAQRLVLTDDGLVRANSKTGTSMPGSSVSTNAGAPRKSSVGWAAGVAIGVVLTAVGAIAVWRLTREPPAVAAAAPSLVVPLAASAPAPAAPQALEFKLHVGPDGVAAKVDGEDTSVDDGQIVIRGVPGTTRTVKVSFQGQESETVVAVTQTGLVPAEVMAPAPAATRPAGTARVGPSHKEPGTTATATATTTATAAPPPTKVPNVSTDTSEFK